MALCDFETWRIPDRSQCPSVIWTRWNWWRVNRWVRSMLRRCHRLSTEASFVFFLLVWFPLQMKLSLLATEKFERFDTRRWTGWRQSPFGRHSLTNRSATMNFSGGGGLHFKMYNFGDGRYFVLHDQWINLFWTVDQYFYHVKVFFYLRQNLNLLYAK